MTIHGLNPSLAEGGKIKIGGLGKVNKGSNGSYRQPEKYDHFLITKTSRARPATEGVRGDLEPDTIIMESLKKEGYADQDGKLRRIPIVLHSDEIDEVFPTAYACYTGTKLHCRGDGQTALRWKIEGGQRVGDGVKRDCPCEYLNAKSGPICKPHGTLHCGIILDGLPAAGSVHRWRTTSIISIKQMIGSLQQIKALCGTLRGIPLQLRVLPVQATPKGKDGQAVTVTVYVCHVELRAKDVMALMDKALEQKEKRAKLGLDDGGYYRLVQQPGLGETPEEEREIEEEFHQPDAEGALEAESQPAPLRDDRGVPVDDPGAILDDVNRGDRGEAEPCINQNQITRLFTIVGQRATQLKIKRTDIEMQLKLHLKDKYSVDSSKDILVSWYDDIVAWVQTSTVAVPYEPGSAG